MEFLQDESEGFRIGEEEGRRAGEDEGSRIGEVELRVGDLIGLVLTPPDLASFLRGRRDNSMAANLVATNAFVLHS